MIGMLIKAFIVGILVIAPTGPTGILAIKNNLTKRGVSGLVTGLGGATADLIFSIIAIFSIAAISDFIILHKKIFELFAGIVLLCIGFNEIFANRPYYIKKIKTKHKLLNDYFTGFGITIINPATLLVFIALYTITGIFKYVTTPEISIAIVIASLFGSIFGWGVLNYVVSTIKRKRDISNEKSFSMISQISGAILIGFSFFLFLDAVVN